MNKELKDFVESHKDSTRDEFVNGLVSSGMIQSKAQGRRLFDQLSLCGLPKEKETDKKDND